MTTATHLTQQLTQARNELNNLRKTIRGLQAEHRKAVCEVKEVITKTHTPPPTHLQPTHEPTSPPHVGLLQDWKPIGHIRSWFRTKNGTPRQGSVSNLTRGELRLASHIFNNPHHALQGLEEFSHVWILFVFDKNDNSGKGHLRSKVAPPRLGGQRVGVFGTRSPHRPNPLGLTLARLDKVEGDSLHLSGLDILDGTPVLDIKPYILQYDAPPGVASHFTNSTGVPTPAKPGEGDMNVLSLENCTEIKDCSFDSNQEENLVKDESSTEIKTENTMCCNNEVDSRIEGEVDLSDTQRQVDECSETCEDKSRKRNTHSSGHMRESAGGENGEQGDKEQGLVQMASWIAVPPTVSLQVVFNPIAEQQIQAFSCQAEDKKCRLEYLSSGEELRTAIASVLKQDPRSVYRRTKCPSLLYYFCVDTAHITAWFEGSSAEVLRVQPLSTQSHSTLPESPPQMLLSSLALS